MYTAVPDPSAGGGEGSATPDYPIESSIELYTRNTPVCLSCMHMTHLYFLVKALVVYFFGFG